jgi:hypothetical protein
MRAAASKVQIEAMDEISYALAQIKSGLGMLRDEVHRIEGNLEVEGRLFFLIDALEGHAKTGSAAFDLATAPAGIDLGKGAQG